VFDRAPRSAQSARRAVFWANGGAFLGFYLLLAAAPAAAAERGGDGAAGVVTAVLMGVTVATQSVVPVLLRRWPPVTVLGTGLVLLGAPALGFAAHPGYGAIVAITAVRGVGFGLVTVVGSLLVTRLAVDGAQGRAVGLYGLISSGSGAFAPGIGLALVDHSPWATAIVSCAPPLLTTAALPRLRHLDVGSAAGGTWRGAGLDPRPLLVFLPAAAAFGGVYSYVPLLDDSGAGRWLLIVFGICFVFGRLAVGRILDRGAPAGLILVLAIVMSGGGMALVGAAGPATTTALGVALGGLGVGMVTTTSLVMLVASCARHGNTHAATAWNVAYDAGSGAGGLLLGLLAARLGVADSFLVLAAVLVLVGLPPALRAWRRPVAAVSGGG